MSIQMGCPACRFDDAACTLEAMPRTAQPTEDPAFEQMGPVRHRKYFTNTMVATHMHGYTDRDPLYAALRRALAAGLRIPCQGPDADAWTSEDRTTRAVAALYCADCPVLAECRTAGRTATAGVWGGLERTVEPAA